MLFRILKTILYPCEKKPRAESEKILKYISFGALNLKSKTELPAFLITFQKNHDF
jgi:hypothetical protein